jgi:hypothetical protein
MEVIAMGMKRIQVDISEERYKELEELLKNLEISTFKGLLNNSLTLLEWAVEEMKEGRKIVSTDEENKKMRELIMPCLQRAAKNRNR